MLFKTGGLETSVETCFAVVTTSEGVKNHYALTYEIPYLEGLSQPRLAQDPLTPKALCPMLSFLPDDGASKMLAHPLPPNHIS